MSWFKQLLIWGAIAAVIVYIWNWVREQYRAHLARYNLDSLDNLFLSVDTVASGVRRYFKTTLFTVEQDTQMEVSSQLIDEAGLTDPYVRQQLQKMAGSAPTNLTPALAMMQ